MVFTTGGITSVTLGYQPNTDYIWFSHQKLQSFQTCDEAIK